jgi:hypothetical protein
MRIRGCRARSRIANGDSPIDIVVVLEDSSGNPLVFAGGVPIAVAAN